MYMIMRGAERLDNYSDKVSKWFYDTSVMSCGCSFEIVYFNVYSGAVLFCKQYLMDELNFLGNFVLSVKSR